MNATVLDSLRTALLAMPRQEWITIAASSGVPLSTIKKIAHQRTRNPRIQTVERLLGSVPILVNSASVQ
jgi:hypothetical protein